MIAQKQESSVQFSRLNVVIFSPAEVWSLVVVLAAFPMPKGWRPADRRRAQRPELVPVRDALALASRRGALRRSGARLLQKSPSRML
jgi:hypothetical protein